MKIIKSLLKVSLSLTLLMIFLAPSNSEAYNLDPGVICYCNSSKQCVSNAEGRNKCNASNHCNDWDKNCGITQE